MSDRPSCPPQRAVLAADGAIRLERCACGTLHLTIGPATLRLDDDTAASLLSVLASARAQAQRNERHERASPPPPHDPTERELAWIVDGWEVRVFSGRRLDYLASHGMGHVQLWHPPTGVSILTPSGLTAGAFEVFPIAGWKRRARDVAEVSHLVRETHGCELPPSAVIERAQRLLVDGVRPASAGAPS